MHKKSVFKRLIAIWPLLFGIAVLATSNGLQGTLLSLRGKTEGFDIQIIGIIMSVYFFGFLLGCRYIPSLISSVGHIRVFAALASIASTSILIHGVFVTPWIWVLARMITGFCFCGLFIISESWLNQVSNKKQRGIIFSIYVSLVNGGMLLGQFLINLAPLTDVFLFALISILISVALAPITLTNKPAPRHKRPHPISFKEMFSRFPLPMVGVFVSGLSNSMIIGLGPVYGELQGLKTHDISVFMACYILGNATLPIVLGLISDQMDRRIVIKYAAMTGFLVTLIMAIFSHYLLLIIVLGGMITSLYSVSITYMNDQIKKSQVVAASRALIMFNAIGAMMGPLIGGILLSHFHANSFFVALALYMFSTFSMAFYRQIVGKTVKKRKAFVQVPFTSGASVMRLQSDPNLPPQTPIIPASEKPEDKTA